MHFQFGDKFKALDRKHKRQQQQHRQKAFNGANISTIDGVDRTFSGECRTAQRIIARIPTRRVADSLALRCGGERARKRGRSHTHTNRPRPTRGRSTMRATATMAIICRQSIMRGDFHSHIAEMPSNKGERAPQRHRRRRAAGHGWSSLSTTPTCTTRPPAKPPVIYDLRPQISLIAADARGDIPLALFHVVVVRATFYICLYVSVSFAFFIHNVRSGCGCQAIYIRVGVKSHGG